MTRTRFVLRYQGKGVAPPADLERVRSVPGADIIDSSSRMLLVEGEPDRLHELVDTLPDWVMAPDQSYPVPDARQKVERPAE